MTDILKVEIFRLKKSVAFWVCFGLCVGLPFLTFLLNLLIATIAAGYAEVSEGGFELLRTEYGVFEYMTEFATFSSDAHILAIIAIAALLGKEFSDGTIRNMILANKRRSEIYVAFWLFAMIIGGIFAVGQFFSMTLFLGTTAGFGGLGTGKAITTLLYYFFILLSSMTCVSTMTVMFLFATKKTSLTILFPLLTTTIGVEIIVDIIIAMITYCYAGDVVLEISVQAQQCIPFYNWTTLTLPTPDALNVVMVIIYNLVFAGLFFIWAFFPFRKADLK